MTATSLGVLLGTLMVDAGRITRIRLHWLDAPMAVWCVAPLLASLTNGLGLYDGMSALLNQTLTWGVTYLIGRIYFTMPRGFWNWPRVFLSGDCSMCHFVCMRFA
ncbi:MAG: hypothetical protein HC898_01095 [Phycisphaerales bacterium]|nr:hypothetical protein [Phycisphaerales bacterium]